MKNILLWISLILLLTNCNPAPESPQSNNELPEIETKKIPEEMPKQDPNKFGFYHGEKPMNNPLLNSKQIMISILPDDVTIEGEMFRFERKNNKWKSQGKPYPVNIGKTGLAWGKGGELSDNVKRGIYKKEGDGKAPAGIFTIGAAFGNETAATMKSKGVKLPFLDVADHLYCVDDVHSEHYNSIVSTEEVKKDWTSAEEMLRKDDLYDLGIFVNHNTPTEAGDGSCIIIHIWRAKGKPTHGCTASSKENILELMQWLDPSQNPLLIQITKEEYPTLKQWFDLPDLI